MHVNILIENVDGKIVFSVDLDGSDGELSLNTMEAVKECVDALGDEGDYFYLVIEEYEKEFLKELSEVYDIDCIESAWDS